MPKGGRPPKIDKEKILREFVLNPPIPNPPRELRTKLSLINDVNELKRLLEQEEEKDPPQAKGKNLPNLPSLQRSSCKKCSTPLPKR
jgi:hypothetical protein